MVRLCSQDVDNALLDEMNEPPEVPGTADVAEATKLAEANASGNKQLDVYLHLKLAAPCHDLYLVSSTTQGRVPYVGEE